MNLQILEEEIHYSNEQFQHEDHDESGNMAPPKETNKALITDPKEMEIYELSDKEFRINLLKQFTDYKNTHRDN